MGQLENVLPTEQRGCRGEHKEQSEEGRGEKVGAGGEAGSKRVCKDGNISAVKKKNQWPDKREQQRPEEGLEL